MSEMFMNLPIDLAALDVRAIITLEPDVDRDGVQNRDFNGVRLWTLVMTCKVGWEWATIPVQFPSDEEPKWDGKTMPTVRGLTARPWSKINDRKKLKGGLMWQATEIGFNPATAQKHTREAAAA